MTRLKHKSYTSWKTALVVVVMGLGLGLGGCVSDQPIGGPIATVGFQHLPKIRLNVASVSVKSNYKSPMQAPNAEQRFPTSPERAMFDWALTRLVAVDGNQSSAVAQFEIDDASVIETKLKKTEGFKAMLTYEPTARYEATAVARLLIKDDDSGASGDIRVTAQRSIEISENATLAQREEAWMVLVENLMADFNSQMDLQTNSYLSRWVR
jgi:hypothetical protein